MTVPDTRALAEWDARKDVALPDPEQAKAAISHYSATGDVSRMSNEQRAAFILWYCQSLDLNPATGSIEIIEFWDPEQKAKVAKVYVKAEAAKQLGFKHRIRVETLNEEMVGKSLYKVTVRGHEPDGRTYDEVGYVNVTDREGKPLSNERYKNALMKCHTVAKRRLILAMIGLSAPPEPDDAKGVRRLYLGPRAEILEHPTEEDRYLNDKPSAAAAMARPRFESLPPPVETGLEGMPDQRPRPELFEAPARPYQPPARFHCNAAQWQRTWFMLVRGTPLESDEARHDFIQWYTSSWPENRRTSSLSAYLSHATDRQAEALVNAAREWLAEQPAVAPGADVEPSYDERDAVEYPDRPVDGVTYNAVTLRSFYRAWSDALRLRDTAHRPMSDVALSRATGAQLLHEIESFIGQVEAYDHFVAMEEFSDDGGAENGAD